MAIGRAPVFCKDHRHGRDPSLHHAQGQTPGFLTFTDDLRARGHLVHTPDLYDGNTFDDLEDGVGYAREVGFAKGALVFSAALPASEFGDTWPEGVGLQIHMMEDDAWADEDLPAARDLVAAVEGGAAVPRSG